MSWRTFLRHGPDCTGADETTNTDNPPPPPAA